jgi:putative oxidoreductase
VPWRAGFVPNEVWLKRGSRRNAVSIKPEFFARLLLASVFLVAGTGKLFGFYYFVEFISVKPFLPFPQAIIASVICLELVCGVLLIVDWYAAPAALTLAGFSIAAALLFQDFWIGSHNTPSDFLNVLNHFWKNLAIVGGLLMVALRPRAPG